MKKIIALFLALIMLVLTVVSCGNKDNPDDNNEESTINMADIDYAKSWIEDKIEKNEVMYFKYDGVLYSNFIETWTKDVKTSKDEKGNTVYDVSYTSGDLVASAKIILYKNHPAVDWVCNFANNGSDTSKRFSEIKPLHTSFDIENPVAGYSKGSDTSDSDFEYMTYDFSSKNELSFACTNGRSSQTHMPYFDITNGEKGVVGAIGWTGQWTCNLKKLSSSVEMTAGMSRTDTVLYAGESMRTPSIVLVFFTGDRDCGHNIFRRLVLSDYTMKDENGEPVKTLPYTINSWGGDGDIVILDRIQDALDKNWNFDICWVDAGWHGSKGSADTYDTTWATQVGTWTPNPKLYPNGFKDISKLLADNGKKLLVWFEPERVYPDTEIWNKHRDYILRRTGDGQGLYNFSDEEAYKYMTDYMVNFLKEQGIMWYRQDFNIDPLEFWTANDRKSKDNRSGMTEIKYITNLYRYIDTLQTEIPGLMMDNCASGGKRLDIEMMKRSVPLWKSDYYVSGQSQSTYNEACYTISAHLNYWLPLSCGGQGAGISDTFDFRAVFGAGMTMGVPDTVLSWWNRRNEEFRTMGRYWTYDYYKLTPFSTNKTDFLTSLAAFEFYSPENGEGCILAFRPKACNKKTIDAMLKGLDPDATYEFTCVDNGETEVLDGYSAMNGGLTVNLNDSKESVIIYFNIKAE